MSHRLREPFGKAGLIVAVLALVMALVGGAYAAENSGDGASASAKKKNNRAKKNRKAGGLNGKQKRQVIQLARREAKRFQGIGPAGPQGVPGIPGPKGPKGDDGDDGSNGSNGKEGKQGSAGDSVIVVNESPENCPNEEGVTYEVEGSGEPNEVCDGEPGTFDPEGFTQTGVYGVDDEETLFSALGPGSMDEGDSEIVTASFPIPIGSAPAFVFVPGDDEVFEGAYLSAPGEGCPGVVAGVPQADPGTFCVYGFAAKQGDTFTIPSASVSDANPSTEEGTPGVTQSGTLLKVSCAVPQGCYARGLWAVTG